MKTQLFKDITAYAAAASSFLFCNECRAQIIYTDVIPDDTLIDLTSGGGPYIEFIGLDLNNDGTFDFWLGQHHGPFDRHFGALLCNPEDLNINSVMGSQTIFTYTSSGNTYSVTRKKYPFQLAFNQVIGPGSSWVKPNSYSGGNMDIYYQAWFNLQLWTSMYGLWNSGNEGYAGVRLNDNGVYNYGWIRLEVDSDARYVILKDYALNSEPDEAITAGKGGITGLPELTAGSMINISPNPVRDHTTVRFNLETPSTVELTLMDVQGRKIKSLENQTMVNYSAGMHAVNCNLEGISAGLYFIRFSSGNETRTIKIVKQ
ncbi:MAG: T9SS type A sorting domain-containing protein [Chitinophagales bacterium]